MLKLHNPDMEESFESKETDYLVASTVEEETLIEKHAQGDVSNEPDKTKKYVWSRTTTKQKFLVLFIGFTHFITFICVGAPFSFLERIFEGKGTSVEVAVSVIQQIIMLSVAISGAIFGKYQGLIGTRRLLVSGLMCFAVCQISFGLIQYSNSMGVFIGVGVVLRTLQGVGEGGYVVAALTTVCQEFGEGAPQVFSIAESFAAIGFIVGPLLGGALYSTSKGLMLPFVVTGVLILPLIPIGYYLVENYNVPDRESNVISITSFIGQPITVTIIGLVTTTYGGFGIFNVLGTIYLESLGISVIKTGLMYLVMALSYGTFSLVAGYVTSIGTKTRRSIFIIGLLGLFGDSFLLTPTQSEDIIYVCLAVYGCFCGFILISSFGELLVLLVGESQEYSFEAHSVLSGTWNFMLGIGTFVVPLFGAPIYKATQFGYCMVICLFMGVVLSLLTGLILYVCKRNKPS